MAAGAKCRVPADFLDFNRCTTDPERLALTLLHIGQEPTGESEARTLADRIVNYSRSFENAVPLSLQLLEEQVISPQSVERYLLALLSALNRTSDSRIDDIESTFTALSKVMTSRESSLAEPTVWHALKLPAVN
jgi:hypothetical protein